MFLTWVLMGLANILREDMGFWWYLGLFYLVVGACGFGGYAYMLCSGGCYEEPKNNSLSTPLAPDVEKALRDLDDLHTRRVVTDGEYAALREDALK